MRAARDHRRRTRARHGRRSLPGANRAAVAAAAARKIRGAARTAIPDATSDGILESLGFALRGSADGWDVTVPTRRVDVRREVDLIEEVARHYGFDRLPSTFPALTSAPPPIDPRIGARGICGPS
jgi:phenylalanyl-tRNA synthetase beta subunit